jgi:hypothetical protein
MRIIEFKIAMNTNYAKVLVQMTTNMHFSILTIIKD